MEERPLKDKTESELLQVFLELISKPLNTMQEVVDMRMIQDEMQFRESAVVDLLNVNGPRNLGVKFE